MKQLTVIFVSVLLIMTMGCQAGDSGSSTDTDTDTSTGDKKLDLDSERAKASYSIGYNMGRNLINIKEEIDFETVVQGFKDGFAGEHKAQLKSEEIEKALIAFRQRINKIMQEKRRSLGEKNKAEGEAFLKENAGNEGVITTKSGLQYKVIKEGTGAVPQATDQVTVQYRGTFINGTEFDSSYKKGKPATFLLNRVIPGWTEGVQLMKVGAKYKFFIPSNLAYGQRGSRAIGPNAVLIFDIELLAIEKVEPKKPPKPPVKKIPQPKQEEQKKEAQKK
jgi:FKBP-type peptidyl-prolyl cis-trans isomerase